MRFLRTLPWIIVAELICLWTISYADTNPWPVKEQIDLSSGFGDYRQGRFHAGLDIRTGGVPGLPVYAPVDGYVLRVKMSYTGYGKALYVQGDDGSMYVFGHLQKFAEPLDQRVKESQLATKRYYVELELPKDSIRIKQGELLAYSGQTGAGAPHLHFEKRTGDNYPLNPLTHGYPVGDKVAPVFSRIGFQMLDERSLFGDGNRKIMLPVRARNSREYMLDTVLYFHVPFGLVTDCFDQVRKEGPKLGVYRLSLYIDDTVRYATDLDTVDFATNRSADLVYDFDEAADGDNSVRRLYRAAGNDYAGVSEQGQGDGSLGRGVALAIGRHVARIVAEDATGNRAQLTFTFLWGPPDNVYHLDSTVVVNDSNSLFCFTAAPGSAALGIDTARVFLNRGDQWGPPPSIYVKRKPDGQLIADVHGVVLERLTLCLSMLTKDGCQIDDQPFNGLLQKGTMMPVVRHELTDQGLFVTVKSEARFGVKVRVELYYQGKLLGTEFPSRHFSMQGYRLFIPQRPEYAQVDWIAAVLSLDTMYHALGGDSVRLAIVGREDTQVVSIDSLTSLTFRKADVYEPRFVEVKGTALNNRDAMHLNSDHYQIFPEVMLLREPFDISMRVISTIQDGGKSGLCRLDQKKDRWVWINKTRVGQQLTASSRQGGSIAAVYDFDPPVISGLNVAAFDKIRDSRPVIQFKLTDSLSGFEDDRNILIKLDGKWQIPEFDPETGICQMQPLNSLQPGSHHLAIEVTDRAGNQAQQYLQFVVLPPQPGAPKK